MQMLGGIGGRTSSGKEKKISKENKYLLGKRSVELNEMNGSDSESVLILEAHMTYLRSQEASTNKTHTYLKTLASDTTSEVVHAVKCMAVSSC